MVPCFSIEVHDMDDMANRSAMFRQFSVSPIGKRKYPLMLD